MSSIINVTILIALTLANNAQATTGHCPKNSICTCNFLPAMKNFNVTNYLGTWYEIRSKVKVGEEKQKCVSSVSELNKSDDDDDDTIINEVITQLVKVNGVWTSITIQSKAEQVENKGRFIRTFPEEYKSDNGEYLVLDTDYESYSVTARCLKVDSRTDTVLAWIYTRAPRPDDAVLEKAFESAVKFGLRPTHFHNISQKNCPPIMEN